MKQAEIYHQEQLAGILTEDEYGFHFQYNATYLLSENPQPISLTFPISSSIYHDKTLFPFFDGLIPEGWLLNLAEKNWKVDRRDRMALLVACCKDCIGAVSVIPIDNAEQL